MAKMAQLQRSKTERKGADGEAYDREAHDGADMSLRGHHMEKMGMKGMEHGAKVKFHGVGEVHRTSDGPEGGNLHIKISKMAMDNGDEEEGPTLRDELTENAKVSEAKATTHKPKPNKT